MKLSLASLCAVAPLLLAACPKASPPAPLADAAPPLPPPHLVSRGGEAMGLRAVYELLKRRFPG